MRPFGNICPHLAVPRDIRPGAPVHGLLLATLTLALLTLALLTLALLHRVRRRSSSLL